MKTRTFTLASILRTIMFAFIATTIFTSCSKDEEEFNPYSKKLLVGHWLHEEYDNVGRFVSSEEYDFYKDGDGYYYSSYNSKGSFTYVVNGGFIEFDIWYSINNAQYMHHERFYKSFGLIDKNTLYFDSKTFKRKTNK